MWKNCKEAKVHILPQAMHLKGDVSTDLGTHG